jgi:hypothetical protein
VDLTAIQPVAAIIGAIITATVSVLVTLFVVVKRKRVTFVISPSEDLTLVLRQSHKFIVIKWGDRELLNLNKGSVIVKNTGNSSISHFHFEIMVQGKHPFCIADVVSPDPKLRSEVKIESEPTLDTRYHTFKVSIPFFNPKEIFEVPVFFDEVTVDCSVSCRMEELKYRVRRNDYLEAMVTTVGELGISIGGIPLKGLLGLTKRVQR